MQKELAQADNLPRNRTALQPLTVKIQKKLPQHHVGGVDRRNFFTIQEIFKLEEVAAVGLNSVLGEPSLDTNVVQKIDDVLLGICSHCAAADEPALRITTVKSEVYGLLPFDNKCTVILA